jgi:hypothetical protein
VHGPLADGAPMGSHPQCPLFLTASTSLFRTIPEQVSFEKSSNITFSGNNQFSHNVCFDYIIIT